MVFRCREAPRLEARLLLMKGKAIAQSTAIQGTDPEPNRNFPVLFSLSHTHLYTPLTSLRSPPFFLFFISLVSDIPASGHLYSLHTPSLSNRNPCRNLMSA